MKKTVTLILVGLLALAMVASTASAAKKKKAKPFKQTVDGTVVATPPADEPAFTAPSACYAGLHRRAVVLAGESNEGQLQGKMAYHFTVDKRTWGKKFKLELGEHTGTVDLDINFYTEFGNQDQALDRTYAPPNVPFANRGAGGEVGTVPKSMNKAIVCIYEDKDHQRIGANAAFNYTAGTGVK